MLTITNIVGGIVSCSIVMGSMIFWALYWSLALLHIVLLLSRMLFVCVCFSENTREQIHTFIYLLFNKFKSSKGTALHRVCPVALARRLLWNLAQTMPLFTWAWVVFPQITLVLLGFLPRVTVFFALYA